MKLKSRAYVVASLRMLNTVDMCGTKLSITGFIKRDGLLSRDCRFIPCWFESKNKLLDSPYTCPTFFSHISNLPDDRPYLVGTARIKYLSVHQQLKILGAAFYHVWFLSLQHLRPEMEKNQLNIETR